MAISSILSNGMQMMQASMNRTTIASSGLDVGQDDFANRMVALREGEIGAKAAAGVIRTADQMLGTLIDIHA